MSPPLLVRNIGERNATTRRSRSNAGGYAHLGGVLHGAYGNPGENPRPHVGPRLPELGIPGWVPLRTGRRRASGDGAGQYDPRLSAERVGALDWQSFARAAQWLRGPR